VIQQFALTSSPEIIYGIDFKSYDALKPFVFLSGGPFTGPDDAIIDDVFAKKDKGYHVGDVIQIQSHAFRICGIVEAGKGGRKMVPIETLGELMGSSGKASLFYIKTDSEANQGLVRQEILAVPGMSQYIVQTMHEWLSLMTPDHIPGFNIALNVVTVIATLVGFLVIFLSMYTAVLERTREIGIIKAVGGGSGLVLNILLRETLVLAVGGTLVGIVLTYGAQWMMKHFEPGSLVQETVYAWWPIAGAIAIVGALLGAVVPGMKAVRQDVTEALSYE
jgi:putative ABC transport system permease protein